MTFRQALLGAPSYAVMERREIMRLWERNADILLVPRGSSSSSYLPWWVVR